MRDLLTVDARTVAAEVHAVGWIRAGPEPICSLPLTAVESCV